MNRSRQLISCQRTWKRFKYLIALSILHFTYSSVQTFEVGYKLGALECRPMTTRYLAHMSQIAVSLLVAVFG